MSKNHDANVQRASRAHLAPFVATGKAVCPKCSKVIKPGQPWQSGHVDDLALGGHVAGRQVPEHQSCGSSAGARLGNALRARPRRRLAAWLGVAMLLVVLAPSSASADPISPDPAHTPRTWHPTAPPRVVRTWHPTHPPRTTARSWHPTRTSSR